MILEQCIESGCKRYDENGCEAYRGVEFAKWRAGRCPLAPFVSNHVEERNRKGQQKQGTRTSLISGALGYRTSRKK